MRLEVFDELLCELGEGPIWDERENELLWVDLTPGAVHRRSFGEDRRSSVSFGEAVGAVALRAAGGWLLAFPDGLALRRVDGHIERRWRFADADREAAAVPIRANDGKCDPRGRFWIGTMAWDGSPGHGTLYRLDLREDTFSAELVGVSVSNGLGWSPEGDRLYYVDTSTGCIDVIAFDVEAGSLGQRRTLVDLRSQPGAPDGLTIDEHGAIWVALWGGGAVHRYTPEGVLDRVVELPCQQVTSCTFAGPQLDSLAITTARIGLKNPEPLAGATFVADVGVRGREPDRFAG